MAEMIGYEWSSWRKHRRVIPAAEHPVAAYIDEAGLPAVRSVRDVSEGGIELELSEALAESEHEDRTLPLTVTLAEPVNAVILTRGRVRHLTGNRVGVLFDQLKPSDRQRLREYVRYHSKRDSWLLRLRRNLFG